MLHKTRAPKCILAVVLIGKIVPPFIRLHSDLDLNQWHCTNLLSHYSINSKSSPHDTTVLSHSGFHTFCNVLKMFPVSSLKAHTKPGLRISQRWSLTPRAHCAVAVSLCCILAENTRLLRVTGELRAKSWTACQFTTTPDLTNNTQRGFLTLSTGSFDYIQLMSVF